jgi:hypothetical protein
MENGSLEQHREFCRKSLELLHSDFFKEIVICPETFSCLEWVIDYHIFLKFFEILSKESFSIVGVWTDKTERLVMCEL